MKLTAFVELLSKLMFVASVVHGSLTDERLQSFLFRNYNKNIRPSRTVGDVVKVSFVLTLLQLISVAEKSEEMTTSQYITLKWRDYRLTWDPKEFGGVKRVRLPSNLFWKPEIALGNSIDGDYEITPVNAILSHDGMLEWIPPAIYTSSCSIQVEYFPFDWQNCTLRFRSFTYSSSEVLLVSAYNKVVVDEEAYTANGEWEVVHCPIRINYDPTDPDYQDITLYLVIQRKPLFYIINIIVPCVLISSLSVLVFYLPSGCSEKTNMSISVLLGLPVYLLLLAKRVPETSMGVPLIGAYLLFTMLSVTFSVIFSVIVLNVYHRSPGTNVMPPWVRTVFIVILPTLLNIDSPILKKLSSNHNARKPSTEEDRTQFTRSSRIEEHSGDESDSGAARKKAYVDNSDDGRHRTRRNGDAGLAAGYAPINSLHRSQNYSNTPPNLPQPNNHRPERYRSTIIHSNRTDEQAVARTRRHATVLERRVYELPGKANHSSVAAPVQPAFGPVTLTGRRRCRFTIGRRDLEQASGSELVPLNSDTGTFVTRCATTVRKAEARPSTSSYNRFNDYFDVLHNQSSSSEVETVFQPTTAGDPYFNMIAQSLTREGQKSPLVTSLTTASPATSVHVDSIASAVSTSRSRRLKSAPSPLLVRLASPTLRKRKTIGSAEILAGENHPALAVVSPVPREPRQVQAGGRTPTTTNRPAVEMRDVTTNTEKLPSEDLSVKRIIHCLPKGTNHCIDAVNFISQHIKNETEFKEHVQEWRAVAMVLDRLMFWIFFILYVTGSLYFAVQALTNYAPEHPFAGESDQKYTNCLEGQKIG